MVDEAGLLEDGSSAGEDDEVGNAADLEAGGELGIGFGVDLQDDGFAGHIGGGASDLWSRSPARAAPTRPEVDQNRHGRILDDVVKEGGVGGERLGERRKLGLAGSAAAGGAEMFC